MPTFVGQPAPGTDGEGDVGATASQTATDSGPVESGAPHSAEQTVLVADSEGSTVGEEEEREGEGEEERKGEGEEEREGEENDLETTQAYDFGDGDGDGDGVGMDCDATVAYGVAGVCVCVCVCVWLQHYMVIGCPSPFQTSTNQMTVVPPLLC